MMHVGLPSWFVTAQYPPLLMRSTFCFQPIPDHVRKTKVVPIIYVREIEAHEEHDEIMREVMGH